MRKAINVDRLRAAVRASGQSASQLAHVAGIAHTTLSRVFAEENRAAKSGQARKGRRPTMNSATLRRLSAALRVPAVWLTGELDSLPFVPKHGLLSGRAQVENEDLSAAKVRLSHLLTRTDKALRADLHAWLGDEAGTAYQSWGWAVVAAIAELASPVGWRLGGIVPKDRHPKVFVTPDLWGNSAAVPWLEQMLAPWFDGLAYLNAGVLAELFRALVKNPQREPYGSGQMDAAILRALGQYEAFRPQPEGKGAGAGAGSGRRRTGARTHR